MLLRLSTIILVSVVKKLVMLEMTKTKELVTIPNNFFISLLILIFRAIFSFKKLYEELIFLSNLISILKFSFKEL